MKILNRINCTKRHIILQEKWLLLEAMLFLVTTSGLRFFDSQWTNLLFFNDEGDEEKGKRVNDNWLID